MPFENGMRIIFELRGRAITQGAVPATRVVEGFDIVEDAWG